MNRNHPFVVSIYLLIKHGLGVQASPTFHSSVEERGGGGVRKIRNREWGERERERGGERVEGEKGREWGGEKGDRGGERRVKGEGGGEREGGREER